MVDIKSCFCYQCIHADLVGAFGFKAHSLYLLATRMVFGSNTSATSWEPFCQAIEEMTLVFFNQPGLIQKHKQYLNMIEWQDESPPSHELTKAVACELNQGVLNENKNLAPVPTHIYVDDALPSLCRQGQHGKSSGSCH